jgi:hypothetical protein
MSSFLLACTRFFGKHTAKLFDALETENAIATPCHSEVAAYLNDSAMPLDYCPLLFWKNNTSRFPRLSNLARRYLAVPVSSE